MGGSSKGSGGASPRVQQLQIQGAQYNIPVPVIYGQVRMPANVVWAGDLIKITNTSSAGKGGGGGGQSTDTFTCAAVFAFGRGPLTGVIRRWTDGAVHKSHVWSFLAANNWFFFPGTQGQTPWAHLTTAHPGAALSYSLTSYVAQQAVSLGGSPNLPQYTWEVAGLLQYGGSIVDCEPTAIISDILQNNIRGLGLNIPISAAQLFSYCVASGTFISPLIDQQKPAAEWLRLILDTVHADGTWSEGTLKLAPYYDQTITGNGTTFVPQLSPVYNLGDDDILSSNQQSPIKVVRKNPQDRWNSYQVEYVNRSNDYKVEVVTAFSQGDIDTYTLKKAQTQAYHPITSPALAYNTARLKLIQGLTVRNSYKFRLPQRYLLLDPHVDIVSITRPELGLTNYPVRIVSIQEDEKTGDLAIEAEDIGTNSSPGYSTQPPGATVLNDGSNPPPFVNQPAIIEPTSDMVSGIPAIWLGASGQNENEDWGGCHVYYSEDGSSYTLLGAITRSATQGSLLANILANSTANPDVTHVLQVDLSESLGSSFGSLVSISNGLADAYNNLMWVDGEFMSFTSQSPLTIADHYQLSRLNRGLFGTTAGAHSAGAQCCFLNVLANVDPALFQWDYPTRLIGQTIYFKFTSFNTYGDEEQDISTVAAYSYTPTGIAFNDPNTSGALANPVGVGVAGPWTNNTAEALGAIVLDSNGNGEQLISIGGLEWNYASQTASHPGLALVDFVWASSGATNAIAESLSGSQDWIASTILIKAAASQTPFVRSIGTGSDNTPPSGSQFLISAPPGLQVGDVMVAQIVAHGTFTNYVKPTGWANVGVTNHGNITVGYAFKVATALDVAATSFSFGSFVPTGVYNCNGFIVAYGNAVSVVSSSVDAIQTSVGTSAAPVAPTATPSATNDMAACFFSWSSTAQLTVTGQTGSSTPTWGVPVGSITADATLQWENIGTMKPYNTWTNLSATTVVIASKKTRFTVEVDGTWAFSNFNPGDRVHWQVLNGTTVIASGRVTLQVGPDNSMEQFGTMFARSVVGYSGTLTLQAQIKVTNGSGSGDFTFAVDTANLTVTPHVSRSISGT